MFKANLVPYNKTLPLTDNSVERSLHAKSDNYRIEQTGYYQALDNGTYYYPAWKHYGRKTNVFCDRCWRQNLRACLGYANFDLCLLCVDELTRSNYDCPSRECHFSKFINDNSVSYTRPEYVDLNRYYYYQHYDMKDNKEENKGDDDENNKGDDKENNKENFNNIKKNRIENFNGVQSEEENVISNKQNTLILLIIIIAIFLYMNKA
jgi:hypothetical protein